MSTSQTRKPPSARAGAGGSGRAGAVKAGDATAGRSGRVPATKAGDVRTGGPGGAIDVKTEQAQAADRMAHAAVFVSGIRCVLMYMVLPAAGPVVSQFEGVILPVNVILHVVTLVTTTLAFRRVRRSNHPWRRALMGLAVFFFVFSVITMAGELLIFFSPRVAP